MIPPLAALAVVLNDHKATLLQRWKESVSQLPGAAELDAPALRDHIPQFIDEMIAAIARRDRVGVAAGNAGSPAEHGVQRLEAGFDIKEVVAEYNVLRGAVYDVAEASGLQLSAAECRVVNRIIDDAIAWAVDSYSREQATELQQRREEHLAFIAHDVRTPLNAIALTAAALASELRATQGEAAEMLRALQRNVRRIDDLVRRVMEEEQNLELAEGMRLIRREMDLWPVVHQLLADLHPLAESVHTRIVNAVPRHVTVDADAGLLTRTLQNLVGNALKFAPGGQIEIGARELAGAVECWVRDDGSGIEPERLATVFDKLKTDPDPARAGFGLGLAIVKQIIEAHGGQVAVESQPGRGSTFRFTIPREARE